MPSKKGALKNNNNNKKSVKTKPTKKDQIYKDEVEDEDEVEVEFDDVLDDDNDQVDKIDHTTTKKSGSIEIGNLEEYRKFSEIQKKKFSSLPQTQQEDEEESNDDHQVPYSKKIEKKEKVFSYNIPGMEEKLSQIQTFEKIYEWKDILLVNTSSPLIISDNNNDLERELKFYNQALECTKEALDKFDKLGVKYRRPDDYFAEMVKSDDHMHRIRQKLQRDKEDIEGKEQRRKQRELKKVGKKIQTQKIQEKQQQKTKNLQQIKQWRNDRKKDLRLGVGEELSDQQIEKQFHLTQSNSSSNNAKKSPYVKPQKSAKRQARDDKYGFGGRKKGSKRNTSDSFVQGKFNVERNKSLPRALQIKTMPHKRSSQGASRPGKNRRQRNQRR